MKSLPSDVLTFVCPKCGAAQNIPASTYGRAKFDGVDRIVCGNCEESIRDTAIEFDRQVPRGRFA